MKWFFKWDTEVELELKQPDRCMNSLTLTLLTRVRCLHKTVGPTV